MIFYTSYANLSWIFTDLVSSSANVATNSSLPRSQSLPSPDKIPDTLNAQSCSKEHIESISSRLSPPVCDNPPIPTATSDMRSSDSTDYVPDISTITRSNCGLSTILDKNDRFSQSLDAVLSTSNSMTANVPLSLTAKSSQSDIHNSVEVSCDNVTNTKSLAADNIGFLADSTAQPSFTNTKVTSSADSGCAKSSEIPCSDAVTEQSLPTSIHNPAPSTSSAANSGPSTSKPIASSSKDISESSPATIIQSSDCYSRPASQSNSRPSSRTSSRASSLTSSRPSTPLISSLTKSPSKAASKTPSVTTSRPSTPSYSFLNKTSADFPYSDWDASLRAPLSCSAPLPSTPCKGQGGTGSLVTEGNSQLNDSTELSALTIDESVQEQGRRKRKK